MDLGKNLTVQIMPFVHERGPVFYASLPGESDAAETLKGVEPDRTGDRERLVSCLWDCLAALEMPFWKGCRSSPGTGLPIQVVHGRLGRPQLRIGEYQGPAVSFSKGGGKIWAALCGDDSAIGLDVAGPDEFQGEYPLRRVFHPQELQQTMKLTGGDLEQASALLWSVKEATVKALGCAFHLVGPRQIMVCPSTGGEDGGYTFPVNVSGKARAGFPWDADRSLWVRSLLQGKMWLSIALLNRQH